MKRVKRTIRIEVETERAFVISLSQSRQKPSAWCPSCNAQVEMVPVAETDLDLCHQLEAADVHFEKVNDGQVFICLGSTPNTEERSINSQQLVHNVRKEEEQ